MDCCPRCGYRETTSSTDAIEERLREACAARGIAVTYDDHIRERDAASLLALAPMTMRNMRLAAEPIPTRRRGKFVEYSVKALARYLGEEN